MDGLISPSVQQYAISNLLFADALKDLSDEELLKSPGRRSNSMLWNAGHITTSRCLLLNMLGEQMEIPWPELFGRGAKRVDDPRELPALDEILSIWRDVTDRLMRTFEEPSEAKLEEKTPINFPVADKTIRGGISFLAYHEACHIGQLAYLRKWLGKGQLVG